MTNPKNQGKDGYAIQRQDVGNVMSILVLMEHVRRNVPVNPMQSKKEMHGNVMITLGNGIVQERIVKMVLIKAIVVQMDVGV